MAIPAIVNDREFTILLFGHAAFQYLRAGAEFRVFELLAKKVTGSTCSEVAEQAGLAAQPARLLMRGLTALGLVVREGTLYRNAPLIEKWIENSQWTEVYDTILFEAYIVYRGQSDFVESLRANSNIGIQHIPGEGRDLYHRLSTVPRLQQIFYNYMGSWSRLANPLLLERVNFGRWNRLIDVGGGDATNAIAIAQRFSEISVSLLDLPGNGIVAKRNIEHAELERRINVVEADMFLDPFPDSHDCVLFFHQLVIWPLDVVTALLKKAHQAVTPGGAVVIFSSIADDSEDGPVMAALDSVYFVSIPATGGMIHTWSDYESSLREAGFSKIERIPCNAWTPHGIIIATKDLFQGNQSESAAN